MPDLSGGYDTEVDFIRHAQRQPPTTLISRGQEKRGGDGFPGAY